MTVDPRSLVPKPFEDRHDDNDDVIDRPDSPEREPHPDEQHSREFGSNEELEEIAEEKKEKA